MWKLVIEDDEGNRTVVPLTRDDYTIGRQEGNTIRLTERNVSREHGRIKRRRNANGPDGRPQRDSFVLDDRSSYNGLFVNGLRVAEQAELQHGDLIQIGEYRIVLQDDAASSVETATIPITTVELDLKATIPMAAGFRGQDLTERPGRFVMLMGPTPGVEYPLDRERMTIGRAEDASISVNHNSVSRLHCEVHALGDGRCEIVDKGSANGVRVNGVDLRRSIIEPGDVIELGDVRFKFVGAGQVFVPGPNESQQLTAISDREAELADPRRKGLGGSVVPVLGAGAVGACIILAVFYVLRTRVTSTASAAEDTTQGTLPAPPDNEQAALDETRRATVAAAVAELDSSPATPATLPSVTAASAPNVAAALPPSPGPVSAPVPAHGTSGTLPTASTPNATTSATSKSAGGQSLLERASEAAQDGRPADVRRLLEGKVRSGHGTPDEVRLVRKACSSPLDELCVDDIKAKYP